MTRTIRDLEATKPQAVAFWLATWFGAGLSPIAPGTMGALATLPLHWGIQRIAPGAETPIMVLLLIIGIWAANVVQRRSEDPDPQIIVVDEVVGVLLPLIVAGSNGLAQIIAVLSFRLFDILKPGPIRWLEHAKPPGLGIMADDVGAGLAAALVTYAFRTFM